MRIASHLLLWAVCVAAVLALHLPLLALPSYWDEAGYYVPAAYDLYENGNLIPANTVKNPHPPLMSMYLAAAWKGFGYSNVVTRAAIAVLAGSSLYALLLLATLLVPPAAGLWAAALTALTPVFFSQSVMAHLDIGATLGTLASLYLYFRRRSVACAIALALLCLFRETGVVLVLVLGAVAWRDGRRREAMILLASMAPLAAWFVALRLHTGLWLGDPEFADYNFWGVMHPLRWIVQLIKRIYQLFFQNFHWVLTLLVAAGIWRRAFTSPAAARRVLLLFIAAHTAFMGVFGGAPLTRYLLPAFPLFFLLAAEAAFSPHLRFRGRPAVVLLLPLLFVACWFWNAPYPYAQEDNLAWGSYVRLHRDVAPMLEALPPGTRILTAWPASDELTRPYLGYVGRPLNIVRVGEFSRQDLEKVQPEEFDVLYLYSRQWMPEWFDRHPRLAWIQARFFRIHQQADADWIAGRFDLELRTRSDLGGQWVEIYRKRGQPDLPDLSPKEIAQIRLSPLPCGRRHGQ